MLTSPLIYSAIIALCSVAREIIRAYFRHRDMKLLLQQTRDPDTLQYLVELEKLRHPGPGRRTTRQRRELCGPRHPRDGFRRS
jgi:hypothetical protein